jgi:hypothetical protein
MILALALLVAALPATALAGGEATVHVEVVKGTRGATGIDAKVQRHERLLSAIEGFGGWEREATFSMGVELGQEKSKKVGGRAFAAKLNELTADRAVVTLRVYDPKGKEHKVVSRFAKGAQTALRTSSADGQESWVFIVTVTY